MPLDAYAKQVHVIREMVRVTLGIQERGLGTITSLFQAIDRDDHIAFTRTFAEHAPFLWGWLLGRARRQQIPPCVPPEVVDIESIKPRDGLTVRTDKDNDYVIDVPGTVYAFGLIWSAEQVPAQAELCHKVASSVARDLVEFRTDVLRSILGAVERDVQESIKEARALLAEVIREEQRYAFLEVAALMRNRGRRAYAVDSVARIFVAAAGYSFRTAAGIPITVSEDIELELVGEIETRASQFTVIKPGDARVVRFLSRVPFEALPSHDALSALGGQGERVCRLGTRLFREGKGPALFYTPATGFRTFEPGTPIPKPS